MKLVLILVAIGFSVGAVILLVILIKNHFVKRDLINNFKRCNVIVDGKKGTGKDILFDYVISKRKEENYYSNIFYGYKFHHIEVKDISVYPNTYDNFINGKIYKINRTFAEKSDIYISDGGIYLPSYCDGKLYLKYPSLPIYYALSRHLYNSNVHVNVQNFNRLWKALREQADYFVHVRRTIKLPFILITFFTTYDKYESAIKYLRPVKAHLGNKFSKSSADIYKASNGIIQDGFIIRFKKSIKYNSRAFEKLILKGKRKKVPLSDKHLKEVIIENNKSK